MKNLPFLPAGFVHPQHARVSDTHHVRPIRPSDVHIDFVTVMNSQPSLWGRYGAANNWPRADMTEEEDEADLARHAREMERHESFNYALLNEDESVLAGCVYIDPPADAHADAEVSWWVSDDQFGSPVERAFDIFVPLWIGTAWPFVEPRFDNRHDRDRRRHP